MSGDRYEPISPGWSRPPLSEIARALGVASRADIEALLALPDPRTELREGVEALRVCTAQERERCERRLERARRALAKRMRVEALAQAFGIDV